MARTSSKIDARERAPQARLETDTERDSPHEQMQDATSFTPHDDRAALLSQIDVIDDRLRAAVGQLLHLGESPARVAALLGIAAKEVRRLHSELEAQRKHQHTTVGHEPKDDTSPSQAAHPQDESAPDAVHSHPPPLTAGTGA